jgi:hypothetical protein
MKSLVFTPVIREATAVALPSAPIKPSAANFPTPGWYQLQLHNDGELSLNHAESKSQTPDVSPDDKWRVAWLRVHLVDREPVWDVIPCTDSLGLNNLPSCLPLAHLEPGDLLTLGNRLWMAASFWKPEPIDAPDELRDKPCPICGGPLGLAPVVECACGRWTHLENPSSPHDTAALNCFLAAGKCGGCGRTALLEPQVFPEIPDCLASDWTDGDEF